MSLKCSHLGCSIVWDEKVNEFICPCHSSKFDITGDVTSKLYDSHTIWKLTTTQNIYSGVFLTLGVDNIFNTLEIENVMNLNPGRRFFVGLRLNIHKLNFNNN